MNVSGDSDQDPLVGATIRDRYKLIHKLGKGAMGVVYKAAHINDGRHLAIKILHTHLSSDPESIKRFQAEAKAASSLMHQHIVRLYDVGMIPGGQPYIAMEFVEGKTLAEAIRAKRCYDTREALPIIRQVCEALAEAHSHGVVHRDIKPANIMLTDRFGQQSFVVVLDFSISKVIQKVSDVDTTTSGVVFGSPAYMSPERFQGAGGDFRTDIYSMGIIMFQMLAGRPPFKSSDLYKLMNDHVSQLPPKVKDIRPDCDIPDSLQAAIDRALEKKPEDRHTNMKNLLAEIDQIYSDFTRTPSHPFPVGQPGGMLDNLPPLPVPPQNEAPKPSAPPPSSQRSDAPVFDINPLRTPPSVMPAASSQANRKTSLEESVLKTSALNTSGRWDKSLVGKHTDRQRPVIRPPEQQRFPIELLLLLAVLIVGLAVICATYMASTSPHATTEKHNVKHE